MDLDIEEDLIIRREIRKNGSSRSFINDSPVKLDQLKFISQYIIEINGQHLINRMDSLNFKYEFLDSFLVKKNTLVSYKNAYLNYSKSLERQKIIVKKVDVLNEKKDFLKFQLDELSNYDFQNWDEEVIQNDYKIAAVSGGIYIDINKCNEDQKQVADEISSTMNNVKVNGPFKNTHQDDPSGDSYFVRYELGLDGGHVTIDCYSFANHTGWSDNFRISILNNEVLEWINNDYGLR